MTPNPDNTELGEIFNEILKHAAIRRGSGDEMLRADLIEASAKIKSWHNALISKARIDELVMYRTKHAKHHDEEYCLDNFHNFVYVNDRLKELESKL